MIIYPHLSFDGKAEEAFTFYQSVLGGNFESGFHYFEDIPGAQIPDEEKRRIMHVNLIFSPDQQIMGSDSMPSAGHQIHMGNNNHISLGVDSKQQGKEFFEKLSEGGEIESPYQKMFWNAYFASFKDKFGVSWMINYNLKENLKNFQK